MTQFSGQRFRVFEDLVNNQPTYYSSYSNGVWSTPVAEEAFPFTQSYDAMSDVVTPGFQERIARGEIINNPMTRTTISISSDISNGLYLNESDNGVSKAKITGPGSVTFRLLRAFVPPGPNPTVDTSHLLQQAAQAVLAGVDATPYRFMEDILEFHKTAATLRDPFNGAAELAEAFAWKRQKNLRKGMTLLSATAGAWLSYRYAFRPIAISIGNIIGEYQNKVLAREANLSELGSFGAARRTSRNSQDKRAYQEGIFYSSPDPTNNAGFWRSKEIIVNVRAGCIYEVTNPISSFAEINGLRLKDLPPNLYNIIPYSWVLEHFVSVEKSIRGMVNLADPKVNILGAWNTVDEKIISKDRMVSRVYPAHHSTVVGDTRTTETHTVTRTPWLPSAADTLPVTNFEKVGDVGFITDLASLVVKRLAPPIKKLIG